MNNVTHVDTSSQPSKEYTIIVKFTPPPPPPRTLMTQNERCGIVSAAKAAMGQLFKHAEVAERWGRVNTKFRKESQCIMDSNGK